MDNNKEEVLKKRLKQLPKQKFEEKTKILKLKMMGQLLIKTELLNETVNEIFKLEIVLAQCKASISKNEKQEHINCCL